MKILFMHPNFPAQFLNLCLVLGPHPDFEIVFMTAKKEGDLPGVRKVYFEPPREVHAETHPYLRSVESAVLQGQSVYRAALKLKQEGFYPDLIVGHSGWGSTLYMKDLYPHAAFIGYFEWFYHAHGTDLDFDPADPLAVDGELRTRTINTPFLLDLEACDAGLSPTQWQKQQFPVEFQDKIRVIHDGVQTERYVPLPCKKIQFPDLQLDLSAVDEVITYVGRGMEPYRGFPQFMQALELVLRQRPQTHAVIVGAERIAYGGKKPDKYNSYKQWALSELDMDWNRVHFTGLLPRNRYLEVLQASSVHVYLTRPFVLSWSMLEAMSAGCLLVASDTPPVREMIEDGKNGLLTDFFNVPQLAGRIHEALDNQEALAGVREMARQSIVEKYNWRSMLSKQVAFFQEIALLARGRRRG